MITPSKNKSLIWIIVFLLLTNIAMLVFFIFLNGEPKKVSRGREDNIASFLQKDMQFDSSQMRAYRNLKDAHQENVKSLFENLRSSKDSFYALLYTKDAEDSLVKMRSEMIGNNQQSLDLFMFQHLKAVRSLCTAQQLPKFDSSFKKVVDKLIGRNRKPKEKK